MGHGVWNPSLLEESSRAIYIEFSSPDDPEDIEVAHIYQQSDTADILATIDSVGEAFGAEVHETQDWYSPYGDRYQYLTSRLILDKAGVFYQPEPFMGWSLALVVVPCYTLDSDHRIWLYDNKEFQQEYGLSIERYKASAWKQAQHLEELIIARLSEEGHELAAGSGYMMGQVVPGASSKKAHSQLLKCLPVKMQMLLRHARRYSTPFAATENENHAVWF